MSTGDVEDKFTLAQLVIMSTIQSIQFEHEKNSTKQGGKIKNKAATAEEQNKRAWKYL